MRAEFDAIARGEPEFRRTATTSLYRACDPSAVILCHACHVAALLNYPSGFWQHGTHGAKRPDSQARWIRCSAIRGRDDQLPVACVNRTRHNNGHHAREFRSVVDWKRRAHIVAGLAGG